MSDRIKQAEKNLMAQLNYGSIVLDHQRLYGPLVLDFRQGDLSDEIGQMRRLAKAFSELADALETADMAESK